MTFKTDAILIGDQEQALITNLQITQAELQAALQKLALVAKATCERGTAGACGTHRTRGCFLF